MPCEALFNFCCVFIYNKLAPADLVGKLRAKVKRSKESSRALIILYNMKKKLKVLLF